MSVQQANPEAQQSNGGQPAERLYAGKYKTVEELERGYANQQSETSKIIADREDKARQLAVVLPLLTQNPERVQPADRVNQQQSVLGRLAEAAGVSMQEVYNEFAGIAQGEAKGVVAPFFGTLSAHQTVAAEDPDFARFAPEIGQFLKANPDVGQEVEAISKVNPTAALRYSKVAWQAHASKTGAATTAAADASGTDAVTSKLDAQLVGGGGARDVRATADAQAAVAAALAKGRATGNWTEYLAMTLTDDATR